MDRRWTIILIAGLMEVVWAVAMDYSEGFTIWYYDVVVVIFLAASTILLAKSLSAGLPVGTAYAVWTGIGAVGTLVVSAALGNESLSLIRVIFVIMIIGGIVGLQATTSPRTE